LQGVLIAYGKGLGRDSGAEEISSDIDEQAGWAVGRRVERDFDFDASEGAEEMNALIGDHLCAAGEDGLATVKIEDRRG